MQQVIALSVLPVLIVLALSGCGSSVATPIVSVAQTVDVSAVQTKTAHDVINQLTADALTATTTFAASPSPATTEAESTVTPTSSPTTTLSLTYTPELTNTLTLVPTKALPTATAITKSPIVAATNPPAATSVDDKFYAGYTSCIAGTDVVHFLSKNSPGEIIEAYKSDRWNYTSTKQCKESFRRKLVPSSKFMSVY